MSQLIHHSQTDILMDVGAITPLLGQGGEILDTEWGREREMYVRELNN
jgi:hypothetical protein